MESHPGWTQRHDAYCLKNGIGSAAEYRETSKAVAALGSSHKDFLRELEDLLKRHSTISGEVKKQAIALIKRQSQTGYVYCIRCKVNSRAYVGQTTNFENRMYQHTRSYPTSMLSDWCSHEIESFTVQILEEVVQERLLEREAVWQKQINAVYSDRQLGFFSADQRPIYFNQYEPADLTRKMQRNQREDIGKSCEICQKAGHIDKPYSGSGIPISQFQGSGIQGVRS